MNFKDKVVIVTGGTRGIGLEVAKSFYEKEANVIIFGSKKESVDKAVEELSKDNILVEGYYPNLNNYQEVVETIDKIYNKSPFFRIFNTLRIFFPPYQLWESSNSSRDGSMGSSCMTVVM